MPGLRKILFAASVAVLLIGGAAFLWNRWAASHDAHKSWTATFACRTMGDEAGMGPETDGYILARRSNGDTSRVDTQLGVQLAPFVATPRELYSFIRDLKLKMTFYRADRPAKSDPTCETRPQEFNPGRILGKGVFHGLPVVKWQKTTPMSSGEEMIVEAWETPDCGCVPVYRNVLVLTATGAITAVTTEILTGLQWGEPDAALFEASGFREVTPSEFYERFRELKGFQQPLYDRSVLQRWDAKQRESLRFKFD